MQLTTNYRLPPRDQLRMETKEESHMLHGTRGANVTLVDQNGAWRVGELVAGRTEDGGYASATHSTRRGWGAADTRCAAGPEQTSTVRLLLPVLRRLVTRFPV